MFTILKFLILCTVIYKFYLIYNPIKVEKKLSWNFNKNDIFLKTS